MWKRLTRCVPFLLFCVALGPISADADDDDFPLDRVMNAFIKIEPHEADLVIRIPLDLLGGVRFPLIADKYYNIAASDPAVQIALKNLAVAIQLWEDKTLLVPSKATGRLAPLADPSFEDYDSAIAATDHAAASDAVIGVNLGHLYAHLVFPIASPNSVFSFDNSVASSLGDYTTTVIRFMAFGQSTSRVIKVTGSSGRTTLDPAWYQVSGGFIMLGIGQTLSGIDNLLFMLCLIMPFLRIRGFIPVIAAFAVGQSVTLIGSAYGLAPPGGWFQPFVQMMIAVSIVYVALENIVNANLRRRWIIAGLFGLVYGFGFADILGQRLQLAGSSPLIALFSFNVGIEIGQLLVLCAFVAALALLFRGAMAGRMGIIVVSALVAHTAWHWMVDRADVLWQTPWPEPTFAGLMLAVRWLVAVICAVGVAKLLARWLDRKWQGHLMSAEVDSKA